MPFTVRVLAALVAALAVALLPAASASARTVAKTAWKVDLGSERDVDAVSVAWRGRTRGRYRVQTSLDGRRFRTAGRVRPRRGKRVHVRMKRTTARFVRLAGRRARTPRLVVRASSADRPRRRRPKSPRGAAPTPAPPPTPSPAAAPTPTVAWRTGDLPAPLPASTGAKRYVALDGSDANPGTEARPWRSIQRALELAKPGDQILVRRGTYAGTALGRDLGGDVGHALLASPQGAPGAPITLQPHPGERVTLAGFVSLPRAAWFRMTGFVVDGADAPVGAEGVSLGNTSSGEPHHVEISYNEIRNFQPPEGRHAHGILHFSGSDTALVGNRIHDIGRTTFYDHGIYLKAGRRVVVANNVISDVTGGYGLHIWGDFDDSWVIHNSVYGSAASGFTIGGNDERGRPDRVVTANNVFAGHSGTADSHQGYAAKEYQPGSGNSVHDNLGWGNARSNPFALSASGPSHNRTVTAGSATAAATDAGEDFGLMLDADGRRRDSRPDIGAFELP
jgi:hypothetical protein